MMDVLRQLIDKHGRLPVAAGTLATGQDLYAAGLTSFAAVQLMLALEEAFDIEFPERMLNRRSFSTMDSIAACINELRPQALAS
ncbi:MAG: acyl carrier protein [Beijerinckiaceae bacterium]